MKEKVFNMGKLNFTDCYGIKFEAIKGVFSTKFPYPNYQLQTFTIETEVEVKTPLIRDLFIEKLKKRISLIKSKIVSDFPDYITSIQRGYFFENGAYNFCAIVGIEDKSGKMVHAYTSTVPIDKDISEKKYEDPELNISVLLSQKFNDFKIGDSVYEFLTKESEKMWLQEPIRFCLVNLLR